METKIEKWLEFNLFLQKYLFIKSQKHYASKFVVLAT